VAGAQVSVVQGLVSAQLGGVPPTHVPPAHASPVVHALPSLQGAVLGVLTQPVAGAQVSVVQGLVSAQLGGVPPTHVPPAHASPVVHALPSLQAAELGVCTQPVAGAQVSVVQGLVSAQLGGAPPTHVPPAHASPVVHALPSSQGLPFAPQAHVLPSPPQTPQASNCRPLPGNPSQPHVT
jgi:hypothetical protein